MTMYRYELLTSSHAVETGTIEASSPDEARRALAAGGKLILALREDSSRSRLWERLNQDISAQRPIDLPMRAALLEEWGQLFDAGLPIAEAVSITAASAPPKLKPKLTMIVEALRRGSGLAGALEQLGPAFPSREIAMIRASEASGTLAATVQKLAAESSERVRSRREVLNAFAYPVFTVLAAIVVVVILLVTIVPALEQFIEGRAGAELPWASVAVMALSRLLREHGWAILIILALAGAAFWALLVALPGAKRAVEMASLRLPLIGRASQAFELAAYLRSLGTLAQQGMPTGPAMALASEAFGRRGLRERAERARMLVMQGKPISEALNASGCCPPETLRFVTVGERTGRLAAMLLQAAVVEEGLGRRRMDAFSRALGPALTIAVGLLVGVIAYTMMSTILAINNLVGL
ncbi:type II secretion system F family protein [Bosea sp. NPDC055332]